MNSFTFELETSKCFKVNIISFKQYVSQPGFSVHTADFHSVGLNINLPAAAPILPGKGRPVILITNLWMPSRHCVYWDSSKLSVTQSIAASLDL